MSGGFGGRCENGWKEGEEIGEGFVDPEQAEGGFFESFAAAGERGRRGLARVSGVQGDDPQDLVDLKDSVRHWFNPRRGSCWCCGRDHHLDSPVALFHASTFQCSTNHDFLVRYLNGLRSIHEDLKMQLRPDCSNHPAQHLSTTLGRVPPGYSVFFRDATISDFLSPTWSAKFVFSRRSTFPSSEFRSSNPSQAPIHALCDSLTASQLHLPQLSYNLFEVPATFTGVSPCLTGLGRAVEEMCMSARDAHPALHNPLSSVEYTFGDLRAGSHPRSFEKFVHSMHLARPHMNGSARCPLEIHSGILGDLEKPGQGDVRAGEGFLRPGDQLCATRSPECPQGEEGCDFSIRWATGRKNRRLMLGAKASRRPALSIRTAPSDPDAPADEATA